MRTIGALVVIVALMYVMSFVPGVKDAAPGFVTHTPELKYDPSNYPDDEDALFDDIHAACDKVPLLIRPIANKPDRVHLSVVLADGTTKSADVDCETSAVSNEESSPPS